MCHLLWPYRASSIVLHAGTPGTAGVAASATAAAAGTTQPAWAKLGHVNLYLASPGPKNPEGSLNNAVGAFSKRLVLV